MFNVFSQEDQVKIPKRYFILMRNFPEAAHKNYLFKSKLEGYPHEILIYTENFFKFENSFVNSKEFFAEEIKKNIFFTGCLYLINPC